jgi:hypothetical protein
LRFLVGLPLRLVFAILRSSFLLIDWYPFRSAFERRLGTLAALGGKRGACGHLLFL